MNVSMHVCNIGFIPMISMEAKKQSSKSEIINHVHNTSPESINICKYVGMCIYIHTRKEQLSLLRNKFLSLRSYVSI